MNPRMNHEYRWIADDVQKYGKVTMRVINSAHFFVLFFVSLIVFVLCQKFGGKRSAHRFSQYICHVLSTGTRLKQVNFNVELYIRFAI